MITLEGQTIFLSASFPSGERGERFPTADAAAIADAVTAVVRAVLEAEGRLVFGAHPTISPLVLLVAGEHRRKEVVEIFQSRHYERLIPDETRRLVELGFGKIHWTEKLDSREESLALMRSEMLERPLAAGVFVGGMEGVVDEFALLRERVPCFLIAAPGGAARRLVAEGWRSPEGFWPHVESPRYPAVARSIVELVAGGSAP
jgi:hypothetical protein